MSCIKNNKRFLFWKYEGDHEYKINKFGRFMPNSHSSYFMAQFECIHCGVQHIRQFVSEPELMRHGIPIETIAEHRTKTFTP